MPQSKEAYIQQCLTKYKNPVTTKGDVMNALRHYRGLQGKLDNFVFNDGTHQELLCLHGTIPVQYKGSTYNIPVCVWLMQQHPIVAPLCFVKPTQDMQIRVSQHVDYNGKVFLPYLSDWSQSSSDLLGLIQVLVIIFSEKPPVFAKPRNAHPHAAYSGQSGYQGSESPAYPYPTQPAMPYPVQPPARPAYPMPGGYPPYPGAANTPYPPYPTPAQPMFDGGATIGEEHIRASLLSAVQDKVRRRVRELASQAQAELEVLSGTERDLQQGKTKLEGVLRQLDQEQTVLDERLGILREKNAEMDAALARMEGEDQMDIDEAVITTAPLYKQLLQTFAEENATQDAIYHLGESLGHGVIELDVFLKQVRMLSRRQFMLRATMQKCRQRAGLAG
ncbi:tumor susceptibility gene 101 protein-like [Pollicipes pollicipes]|uniref:tumor susceptibility gene 101 protein-like n=1 Tax=Pollicipes pollicipes TaxID=41117 RepID=UPI0018855FD4|nr:tumor susceptibility gene 101 protein-like [Pollicipes pollicipes]